ncbi:hypothetical protein [Nocardia sp. NPDC058497]|uniref:hypothetical protein n=1 Tax=Nocardia sp. NPDC058497 TaxID=3346529 RepID=UPI00365F44B0
MRAYRGVLSIGAVRNIVLLGALVRVPHFAGAVLLAVHVVETLHGSFLQAGTLAMVVTVCVATSGPWRGRMVDRFGLRATIAPAIVLGAVCWSVAPFVGSAAAGARRDLGAVRHSGVQCGAAGDHRPVG